MGIFIYSIYDWIFKIIIYSLDIVLWYLAGWHISNSSVWINVIYSIVIYCKWLTQMIQFGDNCILWSFVVLFMYFWMFNFIMGLSQMSIAGKNEYQVLFVFN